MSFLVIQRAPNNTTIVTVMTNGLVPAESEYWWLESPGDLMKAQRRISDGLIGGNYYEKGARYGYPLEEITDLVRQVLGPSEDERRAAKPKPPPIWVYALWAVSSTAAAAFWVGLYSLGLIILLPVLLLFLWRR